MKYFIVYFTHTNNLTTEYFMNGKSAIYLVNRLKWYYKGIITTNKWGIKADYLLSVFVREINPNDFPGLSKREFANINENKSYSLSDFQDDDLTFLRTGWCTVAIYLGFSNDSWKKYITFKFVFFHQFSQCVKPYKRLFKFARTRDT